MRRVALSAALLVVLTATPPQAAPATDRSCRYTGAVGSDGVVHAFGWCEYDGNGSRATGRGPLLATRAVPHWVQVLDVADDGQRLWVLTMDQTEKGTFVTAYNRSGSVVERRRLGDNDWHGSLIARNGEFWAVYTQSRVVNGKTVRVLFQAKTIGTNVLPMRISGPLDGADSSPALAFRPGGGVVLTWARYVEPTSRIRIATSTDGRWSSRDFADGTSVVLATAGSMTALAWQDGHGVHVADTGTTGRSPLRSHDFVTGDGRMFGDLLDVATDGRTAVVHARGSDGVYRLGRRRSDGSYVRTTPRIRVGRNGSLLLRAGVPLLLTGTADNRAYADVLSS
jgi:hypothetical protein